MKYEVRASVIIHSSTHVYVVKSIYVLVLHDTYICTKKSFRRTIDTLRAAELRELNQEVSSIWTFVRPSKLNVVDGDIGEYIMP